jgi:hypothetical protein
MTKTKYSGLIFSVINEPAAAESEEGIPIIVSDDCFACNDRRIVEINVVIESVTPAIKGAKRVQTITLPDSLVYLSFGGNPDPANNGMLSSEMVENGAVIFYKVAGGSTHAIWLPKENYQFREGAFVDDHWTMSGEGHSLVIHTGGTLTLVFEHVEKNHKSYILIHNTDDIDSYCVLKC